MDRLSRALQARGEVFYTIGSSGHEGNAAVVAALRVTDMAFLHYRSNAFQLQRARQMPGLTPNWDMLLSFAASSEDPISGGRYTVIRSEESRVGKECSSPRGSRWSQSHKKKTNITTQKHTPQTTDV